MFGIVPAFRAPEKLWRCLRSLSNQTERLSDVFVHDNSDSNIGYTAAVNRGLREALRRNEAFALILNQDAYLPEYAVQKLTAFMENRPRCAIAGVKQLWTKQPDMITHGGCVEAYPYGKHIVGRRSARDCELSMPMPWVNGAVIVVRVQAVIEFGLMDEGMFLVGSDADWCFTARLRGWEVWYCAEVEVLHDGGVSSEPPPTELQRILDRDMLYFRDKWVGSRAFARLHGSFAESDAASEATWKPAGIVQLLKDPIEH